MNIAHDLTMRALLPIIPALTLVVTLFSGCSSPFAGDTLVAMPVTGEPGDQDWDRAVPLDLEVWMGNVNMPEEIVALDMETSHRSTPDCHHGPSTSDPVSVRVQALYNRDELFLLLSWEDRTRDRDLGRWEKGPEGWTARPGADDGIAILWEQGAKPTDQKGGDPDGSERAKTAFRCQNTCHMMEVDVYDGGTKMRMGMKASEGRVLDLWRWRASVTGRYGLADDMVVDGSGKRGDEGQVLPRENRLAAGTGPEIVEGTSAPYYIQERPFGRQGDVRAGARWEDGKWHLLLRRELDTGDPDDVVYRPGESVPFGVSVFDNTFSEHHVSGNSAFLVLWDGDHATDMRREIDEPMDF